MPTLPLLHFSMRSMKSMTRSHTPQLHTDMISRISSHSLNGARHARNILQCTPHIPLMHHPPNGTYTRLTSPTTPPQLATSMRSESPSDSIPPHTTRHTLSPPAPSPLRTASLWTYWMSISHRWCSPLMDHSNPPLLYTSTHPANLILPLWLVQQQVLRSLP